MKKTTIPWLFAASLLLAACGETIAPSPSSTIPSSISSSQPTDVKSFIRETILSMANGNFALTYDIGGHSFTDTINPRYTYTGYLQKGSVLLQTYGQKPYAYDYTITKDGVEIRGQTYDDSYVKQEVTSLENRNHFRDAASWKFDGTIQNEEFISTEVSLVNAFQSQLDYTGIKKIGLTEKDGLLNVHLYANDPSTGKDYIPEGGDVVVSSIGNAVLPAIEALLSTWKNDVNGYSGSIDNLTGNVSFVSAIYDYFYLEESDQIERQGYSNLDRYNDYVRITDIDEAGASRAYTYEKQADGETLSLVGVNAKNEMKKTSTTTTYSSFGFFTADTFPRTQFQQIGSDADYYTYLGPNATNLAYAITQHQRFLEWPVVEAKAKVENGKITQFVFTTDIMLDRDTGRYFYRYADVRVQETPNVIDGPVLKAASADDAEIQGYLGNLNQDSSVFTSLGKDSAWEGNRVTKAVKGTDFYLKGTYYTDEEGNPTTLEKDGIGYYQSGDSLYSFTFNDAGKVVTFDKTPLNKTLKDVAGFSIASAVLKKDGTTLTTYGDILDLGDSIGAVDNPLTVDPSTFNMGIVNGKIGTIHFAYQGGTEDIALDYAATSMSETLRANLENAVAALNPGERQTFADDLSKEVVYDRMVEQWGEDIAKKVPYLKNSAWEGSHEKTAFFVDGYYESDVEGFIVYTYEIDDTYAASYKAYLKELGYTTSDEVTFENKTDGLQIVVNNSDGDYGFMIVKLLSNNA